MKLSTILSLEDSRNSVRQNSTIQKLTYLTIGYLPIGLMTVSIGGNLFISETHHDIGDFCNSIGPECAHS